MKKSEITEAFRRCASREPTLRMPVAGESNRPIAEPRSPAKPPLTQNTVHDSQAVLGGQIQPNSQNYDDHTDNPRPAPKLECHPRNAPLEASQREKAHPGRVSVRVVSVRKRLLDPDNLAAKWHLDALRFAGIIRDDTPEEITFEVSQRKCAKGEEESTLIEIIYPDDQ